jgi:hypothetical protein
VLKSSTTLVFVAMMTTARTIWNITKSVAGKFPKVKLDQELKVDGQIIKNRQNIAEFLNGFFTSVVENNISKNLKTNKPLDYLRQASDHPFPGINTKLQRQLRYLKSLNH